MYYFQDDVNRYNFRHVFLEIFNYIFGCFHNISIGTFFFGMTRLFLFAITQKIFDEYSRFKKIKPCEKDNPSIGVCVRLKKQWIII